MIQLDYSLTREEVDITERHQRRKTQPQLCDQLYLLSIKFSIKSWLSFPYSAWQLDTEVISNPGSVWSFLYDVCNYILDKPEIFSENYKFNALRTPRVSANLI